MKTQNIILVISFLFMSLVTMAQAKEETLKVYGNCGTCKSHIEKAAKEAGATSAVWNKDTKFLTLKFDASKTNSKKIQQKVAEAGYDTQDASATKEAYDKLDECCQYERKAAKPTSMISHKNCCIDMSNCVTECSTHCATENCTICSYSKACCSKYNQSNVAKVAINSASDKANSRKQLRSLTITTANGNIIANGSTCCNKS